MSEKVLSAQCSVKVGELMSYECPDLARQTLPCFPRSVIGGALECGNQIGVLKIWPRDRVRVTELRGEYALVTHSSYLDGVALVAWNLLAAIPAENQEHGEDDL